MNKNKYLLFLVLILAFSGLVYAVDPTFSNTGSGNTDPYITSAVVLYTDVDGGGNIITEVWLSTDETGSWVDLEHRPFAVSYDDIGNLSQNFTKISELYDTLYFYLSGG